MTTSDQVLQFVNALFEPDDIIEIRRLPSGLQSWHPARKLAGMVGELSAANDRGDNIYVGANPRKGVGCGKADGVLLARSLFADFDHTTSDEARSRWELLGMDEPTLIVNSGHGVHAYWRLQRIPATLKSWTARQKHLAEYLQSDSAVSDCARIMRLPGFLNCKTGQTPVNSTIIKATFPSPSTQRILPEIVRTPARLAVLAREARKPSAEYPTTTKPRQRRNAKPSPPVGPQPTPDRFNRLWVASSNEVERVVSCTIPEEVGTRRNKLFHLARGLKKIDQFKNLDAASLFPILEQWHARSFDFIGTKDIADTYYDFSRGWENVVFRASDNPVGEAVEIARNSDDPPGLPKSYSVKTRLLARICHEIQKTRDPEPFWLSTRDAGDILDESNMTSARRLNALLADGVLVITQLHTNVLAPRFLFAIGSMPDSRLQAIRTTLDGPPTRTRGRVATKPLH